MHDEGTPMAMAAKVILENRVDRWRRVAMRERHAEQPGRLVDNHQQVVLEENLKLAKLEGPVRRLALPGLSIQTRTTSPSRKRREASASPTSTSLTKTLPRSSAVATRFREPSRSDEARNLSSLTSRRRPGAPPFGRVGASHSSASARMHRSEAHEPVGLSSKCHNKPNSQLPVNYPRPGTLDGPTSRGMRLARR